MQNCELKYITDIFQYIDAIQQDRYTIFISSQYDSSNFMDEDTINKFKELGLEFDIEPYDSYYAVINSTETVEQHDQNSLSYWGTLRNNSVQYQIVSNNMNTGIDCSILINHEETAQQQKGINIVIYDNVNWKVIDSAYYDGRLHGR